MSANSCLFQQLFKVPVLFQHYTEHQKNCGDLGFVDFLAMHYWGEDFNDEDDDRDMQLPFKTVDPGVAHSVFIPTRMYTPVGITQYIPHSRINSQKSLHPNPHLGDLFRPPMA
ncbi:hypothetical protein [Sinomicrobium weinanense]|uniref:Uncharacterized protein n=1 Tax=Sinomicrobium weinanense TaxID=2842200 RepID=A0A926JTV5_9FLAO|nr:hypothetical protein [Sinomicrobium weinanense]MBC9797091.1 hypothetical protein [Sinomicrobium weinanense]MBU3122680.1 hypothetical protein [Sinomicrobium weinanense]